MAAVHPVCNSNCLKRRRNTASDFNQANNSNSSKVQSTAQLHSLSTPVTPGRASTGAGYDPDHCLAISKATSKPDFFDGFEHSEMEAGREAVDADSIPVPSKAPKPSPKSTESANWIICHWSNYEYGEELLMAYCRAAEQLEKLEDNNKKAKGLIEHWCTHINLIDSDLKEIELKAIKKQQ